MFSDLNSVRIKIVEILHTEATSLCQFEVIRGWNTDYIKLELFQLAPDHSIETMAYRSSGIATFV